MRKYDIRLHHINDVLKYLLLTASRGDGDGAVELAGFVPDEFDLELLHLIGTQLQFLANRDSFALNMEDNGSL